MLGKESKHKFVCFFLFVQREQTLLLFYSHTHVYLLMHLSMSNLRGMLLIIMVIGRREFIAEVVINPNVNLYPFWPWD